MQIKDILSEIKKGNYAVISLCLVVGCRLQRAEAPLCRNESSFLHLAFLDADLLKGMSQGVTNSDEKM